MLQLSEIFYSIQGEGTHVGIPAVFVRLAGCNLSCGFCDTDYAVKFFSGIEDVVRRIRDIAPQCRTVILTGGEPLAQTEALDLVEVLRARGYAIHIESNGTIAADLPPDVWLCVSPKERVAPQMAERADEVKVIVDGRVPEELFDAFASKTRLLLQPEGNKPENVALALEYAKEHPERFRLSLQTHKFIGAR